MYAAETTSCRLRVSCPRQPHRNSEYRHQRCRAHFRSTGRPTTVRKHTRQQLRHQTKSTAVAAARADYLAVANAVYEIQIILKQQHTNASICILQLDRIPSMSAYQGASTTGVRNGKSLPLREQFDKLLLQDKQVPNHDISYKPLCRKSDIYLAIPECRTACLQRPRHALETHRNMQQVGETTPRCSHKKQPKRIATLASVPHRLYLSLRPDALDRRRRKLLPSISHDVKLVVCFPLATAQV